MEDTQKILLAFITLIVGLSVIGVIATNTQDVSTTNSVGNSSFSIASARNATSGEINPVTSLTLANTPQSWAESDCYITSFVMRNSSGATMTATTDYVLSASTGTLTLVNTPIVNMSKSSNTTYVDYNYCPNDYLNISWGRTVLNLIGGFFAIAMVLISVGLFISVARDNKIM